MTDETDIVEFDDRVALALAEAAAADAPPASPDVKRRLMERVRTALTDRRWDQVTAASNELADILFYLEDV